ARQIDDRVAQFYALGALSYHAARSGRMRLAAQLLGAAQTIQTGAGANVNEILAPLLTQAKASALATLGASTFDTEVKAGKHLGPDEALTHALDESTHAGTAANHPSTGVLGARQAQVAHLIADGLTNKQIGTRLFISERTVDSHVRSILNKLGFDSRAQIAGWIASSNN